MDEHPIFVPNLTKVAIEFGWLKNPESSPHELSKLSPFQYLNLPRLKRLDFNVAVSPFHNTSRADLLTIISNVLANSIRRSKSKLESISLKAPSFTEDGVIVDAFLSPRKITIV
jgi:hypothetical protein